MLRIKTKQSRTDFPWRNPKHKDRPPSSPGLGSSKAKFALSFLQILSDAEDLQHCLVLPSHAHPVLDPYPGTPSLKAPHCPEVQTSFTRLAYNHVGGNALHWWHTLAHGKQMPEPLPKTIYTF